MCFGRVQPVFDRFRGKAVSAVGFDVSTGEWCGPMVEDVCKALGFKSIPRFNGGLYYIEKCEEASRVFDISRSMTSQYDRLGFCRHRGSFNEEPLISIGMAALDQKVVSDDGRIMSDTASSVSGYNIDVLRGACRLTNPGPGHPRNKWWYPFRDYSPVFIHFGGEVKGYRYRREVMKLRLVRSRGLPVGVARLVAWTAVSVPGSFVESAKYCLRPIRNRLQKLASIH